MKSQSRITGGPIETLEVETSKLKRLGSIDIYEVREKDSPKYSFHFISDRGDAYESDEREKESANLITLRSDLNKLLEEDGDYLAFATLDFSQRYSLKVYGLAARRIGSADLYFLTDNDRDSDFQDCEIPDGMPMPIEV